MQALIFDFDGVIVDSEPIHEEGLRRACAPLGLPVREGLSIGLADEDALRIVADEAGTPLDAATTARVLQEKGRYVEAIFDRGEAPPYPGAIELIRAAARELPIAICSAAHGQEIRAVLNHLGIGKLFQTIVAFGDVPLAKPDPAGYRLAAERLGESPRDCLAIEDSSRGVAAALTAGMTTVAVLHTMPKAVLAGAHHHAEGIGMLDLPALRAIHAQRASMAARS